MVVAEIEKCAWNYDGKLLLIVRKNSPEMVFVLLPDLQADNMDRCV